MRLDPLAAAGGVQLLVLDSIDSTNSEALARARRGARGPLWITAARQTAGRGRRGNNWVSEPGNLYASLLLTDIAPCARLGELSFVAGLAVRDAAAQAAPSIARSVALKWPNDLLLRGGKFGGILIESEANAIVIGIGVNCAQHPADTPYPATDLTAAGAAVSSEELFRYLSRTMLTRLQQWSRGAGFAFIRADWLACAAGMGEEIRVRLATKELVGCFQDLDETGRLILRLPGGMLETISAGEVFGMGQTAPVLSAR